MGISLPIRFPDSSSKRKIAGVPFWVRVSKSPNHAPKDFTGGSKVKRVAKRRLSVVENTVGFQKAGWLLVLYKLLGRGEVDCKVALVARNGLEDVVFDNPAQFAEPAMGICTNSTVVFVVADVVGSK
ncbi:hypothetical protein HC891_22210 [Candidatus Gracilibacteria bacterium]|nr:hypothetical protein [Candidatus Gracilibacteria bacterium]